MNVNTYINTYIGKIFYVKNKNFTRIKFIRSGHFEYFLKLFLHFLSESAKLARTNSLKVYWVFHLSISLMTLIVTTFLSFAATT